MNIQQKQHSGLLKNNDNKFSVIALLWKFVSVVSYIIWDALNMTKWNNVQYHMFKHFLYYENLDFIEQNFVLLLSDGMQHVET
jgi:hypothetical protein